MGRRKAKRNLPSFLLPITPRAPLHGASHVNTNGTKRRLKVLIIYLGKPEISVGKSNGFWQASENMGCDLRRFNFSTLFSLLNWFGYTLQRVVLPPHAITITMHNSPGWFVKIVSTLSKDDHGRVSCSVLEQWYLGFSSRRRWFRWWRWWLGWWRWRGLVGLTLLLYILSCLELIIHLLYFPLKYPIKIQSIF